MSDDSQRPIVIKRIKKAAQEHHSGAWKIAYADFVTAMMAFFLLMWLLGSSTKGQLQGIAEYFRTPLKVAMMGGSGVGDATSVIKGGGKDLTRKTGQVKYGESPAQKKTIKLDATRAETEKQEGARLQDLKTKAEQAIERSPSLQQFKKQLLLDITTEGLRIQIVDEMNRPMFDSGGAAMKPYTAEILRQIGKLLNDVPNRVSLAGHTDATPYSGGERGYSNWELSADRANAARRELVVGGLEEGKVLRVVGLGSAVMFDKEDPSSPVNRRISIIVMNKRAEEAIAREGKELEMAKPEELTRGALSGQGGQPP